MNGYVLGHERGNSKGPRKGRFALPAHKPLCKCINHNLFNHKPLEIPLYPLHYYFGLHPSHVSSFDRGHGFNRHFLAPLCGRGFVLARQTTLEIHNHILVQWACTQEKKVPVAVFISWPFGGGGLSFISEKWLLWQGADFFISDISWPFLDCCWVGSVDFNCLVDIKLGFPLNTPKK